MILIQQFSKDSNKTQPVISLMYFTFLIEEFYYTILRFIYKRDCAIEADLFMFWDILLQSTCFSYDIILL